VESGAPQTPTTIVSNHIFVGNTRVASVVKHTEEKNPAAYFYASDHLGSSSVLTTQTGSYHERIEYLPYGETWVEDKATSDSYTTPYKFTGKELDTETGLYYFGARYYDARLSRWISTDPALEKYIPTTEQNKKLKKEEDEQYKKSIFILNEEVENQIKEIYNNRYQKLKGHGGVYKTVNNDLYHYGSNNPIIFIDPDGNADLFFIIEGDLVGITGVEGAAGFVIDLSRFRDTGIFISDGPATGANVGGGIGIGFAVRDIEGISMNIDSNIPSLIPMSVTITFDDKGINGISITFGPGAGVSVSATKTKTLRASDVANTIVKFFKKITE
jgi:RHS repeat-associated protein